MISRTLALLPFALSLFAQADDAGASVDAAHYAELVETRTSVPQLVPPGTYEPKDNIVDVDISEYAGYSGIIVANGGLEPNEDSIFFQKYGFKVRLSLSEEDTWSDLNKGRMAVSVTTADVLPLYGSQLQVVVPALIGFSRGATGIVVRSDIKSLNDLRGKTLAIAQFNETDFLIRFLAEQSGMRVNLLRDLNAPRDPTRINLIATGDSFGAGDLFLREVMAGRTQIDGCVTWDPKTGEVVAESEGKARLLMSNRNLLVVADIMIVNKGFAEAHPNKVQALVEGMLQGNEKVRDNPEAHVELIAEAFGWDAEDVIPELRQVHLANLPENDQFFAGTIDAAGSYGYIYESSVMAYGPLLIPRPIPSERFVETQHLEAIRASGAFADQKAEIKMIQTQEANLETPTLARDIRFLFEPNSSDLDLQNPQNIEDLKYMASMLRISPGSTLLLRGHVDNARVPEFELQGGPELVQRMAMRAVQLSRDRCDSVVKALVDLQKVDNSRLESVGLGWREPLEDDPEQNRRVEVQWFTIE
ncbi:MAG: ABC transporter substrate-binding protein [Kiritimatiellae bacterium]|nr:ABC transporter substrate-binding protein [Kiritimatiellia bacterium]